MSKKITQRKLQFAGNSSYVLTIPKLWIKSVGLDTPNSVVMIEEMPDQSLRIYPERSSTTLNSTKSNNELLIRVSKSRSEDEIIRLVLAGYLSSKSKITISSQKKGMISPSLLIKIEELTSKLWGSEIITQSPNMIVLHDALDPTQMTIRDIIQRAFMTAKNMISWSLEVIQKYDEAIILNVSRTENTLDKLYYFALRQLYQAASSMIFANVIGILPSEVIDYHLLIKNIERMGDHAFNIVKSIDNNIVNREKLFTIGGIALHACDDAVKSFLNNDDELAQLSIYNANEVKANMMNIELKPNEFIISKSILRIADYASDISELVINRTIAKKSIAE